MGELPRYRIHPAIGIARVGDAEGDDQFFVGPEMPGAATKGVDGIGRRVPPFKQIVIDSLGNPGSALMRRQAQRFRIFEYTEEKGIWKVSREINLNEKDVVSITWKVHLANRKASFFKFNGLAGSSVLPKQPKHVRRNARVADRRSLDIDPLPRWISGRSAKPVEFRMGTSAKPADETWPEPGEKWLSYLGELRTDQDGRLVVLGGIGRITSKLAPGREPVNDGVNNDFWWDDISDGPVTAELKIRIDGSLMSMPVSGAWLLVGPPDFAPGIPPAVTLWDILVDLAVRKIPMPKDQVLFRPRGALGRLGEMAKDLAGGRTAFSKYLPSFDDDVAPILRQAVMADWVFEPLQMFHTTMGFPTPSSDRVWKALSVPTQSDRWRREIFARVRKPGTAGLKVEADMPRMIGDDPGNTFKTNRWGLALTVTQYAILEAWARGKFIGSKLPSTSLIHPPRAQTITPEGLDQAAAESCSGGAFFPGLEVGWLIRESSLYEEPFRIKHGGPTAFVGELKSVTVGSGYFSRQMAVPWIADYMACATQRQRITKDDWGWWPSQRPSDAYPTFEEAAKEGKMLRWHRATHPFRGSDWEEDSQWPTPRAKQDPSFAQFLSRWESFGVVVEGPGGVYAEDQRMKWV